MNINMSNGKITVDGKTFTGNNFTMKGNKVYVDGVAQDGELVGDVNITVHGDVDSIENTNGFVKALNVNSVKTTNGSVNCGNVSGDVQTTNGNVTASEIYGKVTTRNGNIVTR